MPTCFMCQQRFENLAIISKHFKIVHGLLERSEYQCGEDGCIRTFHLIKSYQTHWQLTHKNDMFKILGTCNENTPQLTNENVQPVAKESKQDLVQLRTSNSNATLKRKDEEINADNSVTISKVKKANETLPFEMYCTASNTSSTLNTSTTVAVQNKPAFPSDLNNLKSAIHRRAVDTIASLHNKPSFCRKDVTDVVQLIEVYVADTIDIARNYVRDVLESNSVQASVSAQVSEVFDIVGDPFKDLDTDYMQIKALEKSGEYIPPVEYIVGQKFENIKHSPTGETIMSPTSAKAVFFPLRQIFKKLFEIPNVCEIILSYKNKLLNDSDDGIISNFVQGNLWKKLTKNMKGKEVLPLFLFFDDFETGNPLGSHSGGNKLGGVYISIACLPPEFQSSLNYIFQGLLFYSNDRAEFGNKAIFNILINEFKFLEDEGIEISLPIGKIQLFLKLGLVIGDNLGMHSMLGFVENFVGNYACRFCRMPRTQRQNACTEIDDLLRNEESYSHNLKLKSVQTTGIKEECIFHHLDFHCTNNWAVDIMHDLFEGVCKYDMIEIITYFTTCLSLFTLDDLNSRITAYDYGPIDKSNIPPEISKDNLKNGRIRMSAAEMWIFVRHFGLLVGDLVPENNPVWNFYLILVDIIALVTSPSLQRECSILLKTFIAEHNELFPKLFKKPLKPKAHHMIHYPRVFEESGPLVHLWCMRFEAKHRTSIIAARSSNSKKFVPMTLAKKHQLRLAGQLITGNVFCENVEVGPVVETVQSSLLFEPNKNDAIFHKWVQKAGTKYIPGMAICIASDDGQPIFGVIKKIATRCDEILFLYRDLFTTFHEHFNAYEVSFFNDGRKSD